jgi:hypothetical protein
MIEHARRIRFNSFLAVTVAGLVLLCSAFVALAFT